MPGCELPTASAISTITYPSGTVVDFTFDALGRISGISATPAGGSASTILTGAAYHPFGAVKSFTHGNGATYARSFDLDGWIWQGKSNNPHVGQLKSPHPPT